MFCDTFFQNNYIYALKQIVHWDHQKEKNTIFFLKQVESEKVNVMTDQN
jgi:hypothetical protein